MRCTPAMTRGRCRSRISTTRSPIRDHHLVTLHRGTVTAASDGALALKAEEESLDAYTLALGESGVAVRRLELLVSPLESMFFALTGGQPEPDRSTDAEIAPEALAKR